MTPQIKQRWLLIAKICASALIAYVLYHFCKAAFDYVYNQTGLFRNRDYLAPIPFWNHFVFATIVCAGIFLISMLLIWKPFILERRLAAIGIIVFLLIGITIAHEPLRTHFDKLQKNTLEINEREDGWAKEVDLAAYEPFRENTFAKSLDEEATLSFTGNLPRLDGATALYPLYAAFARATYPEAEYKVYDAESGITCSRTAAAFENLLEGTADMIFLMGLSEEQRAKADELGLELILTPIGKEAFVFFVNKRNLVSNISVENIKDIYSGKITNWRELGGENLEILVYQRPETSGSQTMLKEIMEGIPIIESPGNFYMDMMKEMYIAVAYKNHKNALGYSFRYYIEDMIAENKINFLSINGVEPTPANIANGTYPFTHDFYAITVKREHTTEAEKAREENTQKLLEWILSPQGQTLIEKTGYIN